MQYFFNDHLRWNLGFETPNQGGAWVATLLPWLWGLTLFALGRLAASNGHKHWGWRLLTILFVGAECVATWALVKTYSRGALAGVLAALVLAVILSGWLLWRSRRVLAGVAIVGVPVQATKKSLVACFAPWLGRGILLVALLSLSDFTQRLTPDYATSDKSVTNRVDLWKGGLELIAISPVRGWGWGNSGASFMHWTQPIGRSEEYKSMVNSYLTVGVEGGLPMLAGVLIVCALALVWGMRRTVAYADSRGKSAAWLPLAATCSWFVWLVCLFFSNLWIIPLLWVIPAVTVVCLAGLALRCMSGREARLGLVRIGLMAVVVCGGLWFAGARLESAAPVQIIRYAGGDVELVQRNKFENTARLVVLPDSQVLGEAYGQELRRWVVASPSPLRLFVPVSSDGVLPAGEVVVAFGAACSDSRLKERLVMLVHPTLDPDDSTQVVKGSILQLSGIDVVQKNAAWTDWAATRGLTVGQSWGLATDVRSRWPGLILEAQSNFKNM